MIDTLIRRRNVDDRAQFCFIQDVIILRFASSYTDNATTHGLQSVHRRGVTVELIKNNITLFHHLAIRSEWYAFGHFQLYPIGILITQVLRCG